MRSEIGGNVVSPMFAKGGHVKPDIRSLTGSLSGIVSMSGKL